MTASPAKRISKHWARRSSLDASAVIRLSERSPRRLDSRPCSHRCAPVDVFLDGVVMRFTDGYTASAAPLRSALEVFRRHATDGGEHSARWFWLAWVLAGDLWDDALQEELATRAIRLARDAGALGHLPIALVYRAGVHIHAGEFTAAAALIEEANSIAAATGYAPFGYGVLLVVWRGNEAHALDLFAWAQGTGRAVKARGLAQLGYMSAILYNALGRYDEALPARVTRAITTTSASTVSRSSS